MRLAPTVVIALAVLLAGCKDECVPSTDLPFCDGNTVVLCPEPGVDQVVPNQWRRRDCLTEQTCVQDDAHKTAFCALAASPNALCASDRKAACESETSMVYCLNGWATSRFQCRKCLPADLSVECQGGLSWKCTTLEDCATGLVCAQGFCANPADR